MATSSMTTYSNNTISQVEINGMTYDITDATTRSTVSQLDQRVSTLEDSVVQTPIVDCNAVRGWYIGTTEGTTLNTPYKEGITTNTAGLLISTDVTANYAGQLWVAKSDGAIFARGKGSGTWAAWELCASTKPILLASSTISGITFRAYRSGSTIIIQWDGTLTSAWTGGTWLGQTTNIFNNQAPPPHNNISIWEPKATLQPSNAASVYRYDARIDVYGFGLVSRTQVPSGCPVRGTLAYPKN